MSDINARDADGDEHVLRVTTHAGIIRIYDDAMVRVLGHADAVQLVLALVHALGSTLEQGDAQ